MKVAFISGEESMIPAEFVSAIRNAGIEFSCHECIGEEATEAFSKDADFVWMRGANRGLTGEVLRKLPKCRGIMRSGSGMDAMPCAVAKELGIEALNTPEAISESVAEHAVALLLATVRRITVYDKTSRDGYIWGEVLPMNWHFSGRTLGLVGYGHIARLVERMVQGFRMNVIHYDPFVKDSTPLDELLKQSDFVSLHCPLTDETRHLIDERRLALMKPNAILVNTSRGPVVDEAALEKALRNGVIGAAAIDVLENEPLDVPMPENHPMRDVPNLIITPHIAAFSADFDYNFWNCSVQRILDFAKCHPEL